MGLRKVFPFSFSYIYHVFMCSFLLLLFYSLFCHLLFTFSSHPIFNLSTNNGLFLNNIKIILGISTYTTDAIRSEQDGQKPGLSIDDADGLRMEDVIREFLSQDDKVCQWLTSMSTSKMHVYVQTTGIPAMSHFMCQLLGCFFFHFIFIFTYL